MSKVDEMKSLLAIHLTPKIEQAYYDRCSIAFQEHYQTFNDITLEIIEKILKEELTK